MCAGFRTGGCAGVCSHSAIAKPWKFGVMGDTQWTCPADPQGNNPNSVSASIIEQINPQFVKAGVEFVIQVGDLTDNGTDDGIKARAAAAKSLIDAGIGFFPMRGNHETIRQACQRFRHSGFSGEFPANPVRRLQKIRRQKVPCGIELQRPDVRSAPI